MSSSKKIDVTIVGGGMITHDLILPSIYHLQRSVVGKINVCALNCPPLQTLKGQSGIQRSLSRPGLHALSRAGRRSGGKIPEAF